MQKRGFRGVAVMLLASSVGVGCASLRADGAVMPERTAPLVERQRAYTELKPVRSNLGKWSRSNGGGTLTWLELGNGAQVRDPLLLLSVVSPETPTAHYARTYDALLARARPWLGVGGALMGAGLGYLIGAFAFDSFLPREAFGVVGTVMVGASVALMGVASTVVGAVLANAPRVRRARSFAFERYELSLEQTLDIEDSSGDAPAPQDGSDEEAHERSDVPRRPLNVSLLPSAR